MRFSLSRCRHRLAKSATKHGIVPRSSRIRQPANGPTPSAARSCRRAAVAPADGRSAPEHRAYPYLLRNLEITRPGHVGCADLTYILMRRLPLPGRDHGLSAGWTSSASSGSGVRWSTNASIRAR